MSELDDTLIAQAQAGNRDAIGRLLRLHHRAIERMCRRMCRHGEDVEDVLQETLIAIVRSLPSFRADASFLTWAYTILRTHRGRALRGARREQARRELLVRLGETAPHTSAVEGRVESRELLAAFTAITQEIGPMDAEVAFLRDVEGLSAAEVSMMLGISVSAVKSRLHRARAAIRSRLAPLVAA